MLKKAKRMKRFFCLLTLISFGLNLLGQSRLHFVDAVTGKPVPYVHVLYGDNEGRYSDEGGYVTLPENTQKARTSHITYDPIELDISTLSGESISLTPVITELRPAIVLPRDTKKQTIGYAAKKGESVRGGKNGSSIAEYFNYRQEWAHSPVVSAISLNLNATNLKRQGTTVIDGEKYTDGVTHVAKLRVDLRSVDPATGGPGASLIEGGVIYSLKDKLTLDLHKRCKVSLPEPVVFPETGEFVVVEWIVTDDVRPQDMVIPSSWRVQAGDGSTSWIKWPVGTPWKRVEKTPYDKGDKVFCISLEMQI